MTLSTLVARKKNKEIKMPQDQCDQMAKHIFNILAIYNNENLHIK